MLSADGFSCFPCFAGCFLCSSTHYYQCTACFSSYYLLNVLCDTQCPSGFNSNAITNKCDLVNSLIVDLELDDYIVLDNLLGFNVGSINTNTYPVLDVNDPTFKLFINQKKIRSFFCHPPTINKIPWAKRK